MRDMSRPSALRNITQILAGCNMGTAARPPACSQGCVALLLCVASLRRISRHLACSTSNLGLGLPHGLLQLSSGMKGFCSCRKPELASLPPNASLACGVHTSQLNEWLQSFSLLFFSFLGLGFCPVLSSPPGEFTTGRYAA